MHKRKWDVAFRYVPLPTLSPLILKIMSIHCPPNTPPNTHGPPVSGATPTRAGNHFTSSTNLEHTQQEIKTSLWGRIHRNDTGIIEHLIKPQCVDSDLVASIERALGENAGLQAACDILLRNAVPEMEMYQPMVSVCVSYCEE